MHLCCAACGSVLHTRSMTAFLPSVRANFLSLRNLPPMLASLLPCRGLRVYVMVWCSCWPQVKMLYHPSFWTWLRISNPIINSKSSTCAIGIINRMGGTLKLVWAWLKLKGGVLFHQFPTLNSNFSYFYLRFALILSLRRFASTWLFDAHAGLRQKC